MMALPSGPGVMVPPLGTNAMKTCASRSRRKNSGWLAGSAVALIRLRSSSFSG